MNAPLNEKNAHFCAGPRSDHEHRRDMVGKKTPKKSCLAAWNQTFSVTQQSIGTNKIKPPSEANAATLFFVGNEIRTLSLNCSGSFSSIFDIDVERQLFLIFNQLIKPLML